MDDRINKGTSPENLSKLSSDFEIELLRLLKTLNLISQSRELYKNQVEEIESICNNLKIRINDFTIKLLEIEKKAREDLREYRSDFTSSSDSSEPNDFEVIIKEVNEFREKIDAVDKDIERAKTEHLSKLDSFYTVYNLELKASQGELDTKLTELKELMSQAVPEASEQEFASATAPAAQAAMETQGNGSGEKHLQEPPPEMEVPPKAQSEFQKPHTQDLPKRSINLSQRNKYGDGASIYTSNGLLMGIIFIFFGALVGITSYYLLDYIGGNDSPSGLREDLYTEDSLTSRESLSSGTGSEREDLVLHESAQAVKKETPEIEPSIKTDSEYKYSDAGEKSVKADQEAESPLRQLLGEPSKTTSIGTGLSTGSEVYTVLGPGANVRNGPGMNHSVATVVLEGDQFSAIGEKRGIWIKVLTPDGTEGWISKKVVKQIN